MRSGPVRQAIFLFSSFNLWPLCDFQQILLADQIDYDLLRDPARISRLEDVVLNEPTHSRQLDGLYIDKAEYFKKALTAHWEAAVPISAEQEAGLYCSSKSAEF